MKDIYTLAKPIKLLALDVDGVLSDGKLYFSAHGDELKAFNILDGQGIKLLQRTGVQVAVITGRSSPLTARRARDLGIDHLQQGREDKLTALKELLEEISLTLDETAYVGDDLPDLSAIKHCRLGISVPNGCEFVKEQANWCTQRKGGEGAVREVCDLIMSAQGTLDSAQKSYLDQS